MKKLLITGVALAMMASAPAIAQEVQSQTTVVKKKPSGAAGGAAAGAVAGAAVGGPVGAAVGAVAGAAVGHAVAPPAEVRTYVTTATADPVRYGRPIVVGKTIDGEVTWLEVPSYPKYRWAYVDGHRVVIDNDSHEVVAVY